MWICPGESQEGYEVCMLASLLDLSALQSCFRTGLIRTRYACRWDEDVFGLEYDLDLFNIVAVHDFNMGKLSASYRTTVRWSGACMH